APGRFDPSSSSGQELLGHELAHVVQQSQGGVSATGQANGVALNDDSSLESQADSMGARAARGEDVSGGGATIASAHGAQPVQAKAETTASTGATQAGA